MLHYTDTCYTTQAHITLAPTDVQVMYTKYNNIDKIQFIQFNLEVDGGNIKMAPCIIITSTDWLQSPQNYQGFDNVRLGTPHPYNYLHKREEPQRQCLTTPCLAEIL